MSAGQVAPGLGEASVPSDTLWNFVGTCAAIAASIEPGAPARTARRAGSNAGAICASAALT
ncbi:MAG: hypothetical protein ACRELY_18545, partial [Polyangiaceae bacterium]